MSGLCYSSPWNSSLTLSASFISLLWNAGLMFSSVNRYAWIHYTTQQKSLTLAFYLFLAGSKYEQGPMLWIGISFAVLLSWSCSKQWINLLCVWMPGAVLVFQSNQYPWDSGSDVELKGQIATCNLATYLRGKISKF